MTDQTHLNPAGQLPPVRCPLLIEVEPGQLRRAQRMSFVRTRDAELEFCLEGSAERVTGRFRWTYP